MFVLHAVISVSELEASHCYDHYSWCTSSSVLHSLLTVVIQRRSVGYWHPGQTAIFLSPKSCDMPDAALITRIFAVVTPIFAVITPFLPPAPDCHPGLSAPLTTPLLP